MNATASPDPLTQKPRYSFFDAASRQAHPFLTALLATGAYGQEAPSYLGALQQQERAEKLRRETLQAQIEPRLLGLEQRQGHFDEQAIMEGRHQAQAAALNGDLGAELYLHHLDPDRDHMSETLRTVAKQAHDRKARDERPPVVQGDKGFYTLEVGPDGKPYAAPLPVGAPPAASPATPAAPGGEAPKPQDGGVVPTSVRPSPAAVAPAKPRTGMMQAMTAEVPPAGVRPQLGLKPAKEATPHLVQNEQGVYEPVDPTTGLSPITGKPVHGKGPANLAGIQPQLDNASAALQNMKAAYDRSRSHGPVLQTLGAMGAGLSTKFPSLRGAVERNVPAGQDAVIHENNRATVAVLAARPLFGTARAQGLAEKLEQTIPHFTDTPEVAKNFYDQFGLFLQSARRLPWDKSPEDAQEKYGQMLDAFLGKLGPTPSAIGNGSHEASAPMRAPGATAAGSDAGQNRISALLEEAHRRALLNRTRKPGGQ